jgi:ADP-heptose:LPS heptosyltransferase
VIRGSWESKLWPGVRFAELAVEIERAYGIRSLVLWGNDNEKRLAESIVAASRGAAILAPHCEIPELCQLLRAARLVVGSDTGPIHIAAAAGTPTVGLYGPTRKERTGPYGPNALAVQKRFQGGPTRWRRNATNRAMQAIEVSDVMSACDEMLGKSKVTADLSKMVAA